jgi:hypothetical protein
VVKIVKSAFRLPGSGSEDVSVFVTIPTAWVDAFDIYIRRITSLFYTSEPADPENAENDASVLFLSLTVTDWNAHR